MIFTSCENVARGVVNVASTMVVRVTISTIDASAV